MNEALSTDEQDKRLWGEDIPPPFDVGHRRSSKVRTLLLLIPVVTFPFGGWALGVVGGFPISPPFASGALLLLGALALFTLRSVVLSERAVVFATCILLGVIVSGAGVILQTGGDIAQYLRTTTLAAFFAVLPVAVVMVGPVRNGAKNTALRRVAVVQVGLGVCLAVYAVYQILARLMDLPLAFLPMNNPATGPMRTTEFLGYSRPSSVFAEPSWFGIYMVDLAMLSLVLCSRLRERAPVLFRVGQYVFPVIVVITLSVGAYINLALSVVAASVLGWLRINAFGKAFVVLGCVIVINWGMAAGWGVDVLSIAWQRIAPLLSVVSGGGARFITGESFGTRMESIYLALEIFEDAPITGIGVGNFARGAAAAGDARSYVDSAWLTVLAEQGLVGLVLWMLAFVYVLRPAGQPGRPSPYFDAYRGVVMARAIGMLILGSLWDFWIFLPLGLLAWSAPLSGRMRVRSP